MSGDVTHNHQAFVEHITNLDPQLAVFDGMARRQHLPIHIGDTVYSQYRASDGITNNTDEPLDQVD